ncbi:MAG: NAD(P)-binding protein [Ilumatobacteraceae bacterium]
MSANEYDAIVVGGGHNGLVAAGLMAKAGQRVVVLEARDVFGGAAITERPFGPDYQVTALSYVVSLMPPAVSKALELERFGYHVYPQGPYFAPYADGRYLQLADDPAERHRQIAKFSARDADAMVGWDEWLGRLAAVLGPMLDSVPPKIGSKRPSDLADLGEARLADARPRRADGGGDHPAVHRVDRRPRRGGVRVAAAARRAQRVRRDRHLGRAALAGHGVRDGPPQDR